MRREDIANFLTAERRVSPLMAFSLLIVAGFIAGSLQLVAPVNQEQFATNQNAMTAQAAGSTGTSYDSPAPENCTEAIKAALGKRVGPQVTSTDKGQSGTVDACFGAFVKEGKQPSQNPQDYDCVGRIGDVIIKSDSVISATVPNRGTDKGKCTVRVCQPYTGQDGQTVDNCGQPKLFESGQSVTSQSGGTPPIPTGSAPTGSTPSSPVPSNPTPNGSGDVPPVQGLDGATPQTSATGPNAADQINNIGASLGPSGQIPPSQGFGDTPSSAVVPGQPTESLQPSAFPSEGAQPITGLNAPNSGYDPNAQFQPNAQQQTTFPNGQPLNANTYPTTPSASNGFADTTRSPWEAGAAPINTYGQPDVTLPTLQSSTMGAWSNDAMANPGAYAALGQNTTSWNDVPSSVPPPVQDLNSGINTPIDCTSAGCTAKPVTQAETQALQRDGFTCANGSCSRPAQNGAATNPYLNGTNKPNPSTANNPTALTGPGTNGSVGAVPQNPGGGGGGSGGGGGGSPTGSGSGSGGASKGLMSFLGGLMKGLGGTLGASMNQLPASACPTDPQQYAQYQQQYNQQLQQYNYQLQQYNYQQQQNSQYGYSSYSTPPQPPQPCNSGGAGQCQSLPAQPDPSTCPTGTWRQMTTTQNTGSVCPVWQCVAGSGTTPTAQLTCNPAVAENGTQVAISYSCTNAQSSTGYGFVTGGALSGATTTIINAPAGASGINFALKCENGNLSSGAQCSVQIAKVSITLQAQPPAARIGDSALIGWVTSGMESCTVSSPDQPDFTDRNATSKKTSGIATTSPITENSDFYLNCKTVTGDTREEMITVGAYHPGTVTASIENRTNVQHGQDATVQWNFPDAPDVSAVALWLYSVEDQRTVALITGHRAKAGSYVWSIPSANDACDTSSNVCGPDLIPGRTYQILATLYTPTNAGLGEYEDPNLPEPQFLDSEWTKSFKISQ